MQAPFYQIGTSYRSDPASAGFLVSLLQIQLRPFGWVLRSFSVRIALVCPSIRREERTVCGLYCQQHLPLKVEVVNHIAMWSTTWFRSVAGLTHLSTLILNAGLQDQESREHRTAESADIP